MRKKRILIVCPYDNGTIGKCSLNLWKAIETLHEVEVKCIVKHHFANGYPEFAGCEVYSNIPPKGGIGNLTSIRSQINWLRRQKKIFKPDITISTLFSCSALNVLAGGSNTKIGIFHSPHYQAKAHGRFAYAFTLFYYKFLFPHLDRLFCVSNEVKRSIIKSFPGIDPKKVSVVYNAHDIEDIRRKGGEEIEDAKEKEIFTHPTFVYVGRFDRNKAPERALRAFSALPADYDAHLVYIGGGNERYQKELEEEATRLDVSDRVHFLGHKSNPYIYLSKATALVSCSYSEGLPGVIIEALVLGTPTIATNSSEGIWEILSCDKDFDRNMKENYVASAGIITPNSGDSDHDIKCLNKAMYLTMTTDSKTKIDDRFIEKVSFANVAKHYISTCEE